jgi:hypothetical protein
MMRLTRLRSGALRLDIDSDNLQVRKTLHANGDFDLALRAADDLLTVVRRGERLRVLRRDRTVDVATASLAEGDLDRLQEQLAGSTAVRRFRAMKSMLAPPTRCTGLGAAVDLIDMLIGVLKGEPPSPGAAATAPRASAISAGEAQAEAGGPTCYEIWVAEVVEAWDDYEGCINSFVWYNPLREVCALAWVIRVESAWFRLIGCSSIPIKVEACNVESEDRLP